MSTTLCQIVQPRGIQLRDLSGWSLLQSLSNPRKDAQIEDEKVYIHPLTERAKSALSEKSLEMCTESLGSETGSVISENEDDLISSISKPPRTTLPCYSSRKLRLCKTTDLPPPLSTIVRSGSSCGVRVKSLREDGRLVLKAVSVGTPRTCFKAVRRDGTLQLRMFCGETDVSQNQNEFDVIDDDHDDDEKDDVDEFELDSFGRSGRCKEEEDRRPEIRNWEAIWVSVS
ncbi:hypothetical protein RND81_04G072600 [Saponaria officinalis]|uniref:FAF domain-containing protein n=1 Tax=Saponaria officinalis TaxID=3572 RepID=A0AAW1LDA2_SAPOF